MIHFESYLPSYRDYLEHVRGLSPRTIAEYLKDLRLVAEWSAQYATPVDARFLTSSILMQYESFMSHSGLSVSCIKHRVSALRSFFRFMLLHGYCTENPAQYIPTPRASKPLIRPASAQAIRDFLWSNPATPRAERTQALVALIYATGIRLGEALSLTQSQFDFERHRIIIHGKGSKERYVYYAGPFAPIIEQFVTLSAFSLFGSLSPIAARYDVAYFVNDGARGANPHQIRHTYACECLQNGMPLKTLSILLGHESIKTTERYLYAADPNLESAAKKFSPR